MRNRLVAIAGWSARRPWLATVGWFVFVALCVGVGVGVGGRPAATEDFRIGEAGRGEAIAASGGLQQRAVERILITGNGARLDAAADGVAREVTDRMRALPEVESVAPPVYTADRTALRIDVTMAGAELDGDKHVGALRAQTELVQRAHPGLLIEETGGPSVSSGVDELRGRDLARTEMIALPVTVITLLFVFRSVALALVPVLLAVSSIVAAIGLSMPASHLFPDNGIGTNIILLIGLAVGVDYTLFYLKRAREERARCAGMPNTRAVVELAAATSGRAVVVSGLAVAASTATLYLADDVIFSSIATAAILVTLVAVVSSLTALPALLAMLTERAERRAVRRAAHAGPVGRTPSKGGRFTGFVLRGVAAKPATGLAVSVLAMLVLTAPVVGLELTDMGRETHPRTIPAMQTFDRLHAAFPELKSMHQVVVTADPARANEVASALRALAGRAAADSALTGTSNLRTSGDGRVSLLELPVRHHVGDKAAVESLERVRGDYVPATIGALSGIDFAVTGEVARYADYPAHQKRKLPMIVAALLLVTFVLTAAAFRSLVLGLIGVVLNLLSAGASLGLLTLVFQNTWAEGLLDFDSTGTIGSRVPLLLFVILFGLSMDYQVFVLSRIKEAVDGGATIRQAVLDGVGGSAGVVTSAAFVMVTVFASFVPLHIMEMKQMGFALAAAVLLDAFVIRIVILPALLLLLGNRTWWPTRPTAVTQRRAPVKVG
ncbi:MMPL family transporter [Nocardia sp. CDC159]|uniref:MMPL family transporter n=1 Tax=Nocardia pulmonis TaxID=2951408 RepID=A0A9X2EFC8_9NOCA|nr:MULTISPECIES: MMPL family transporter [Nocardia]MCM6778440.1 MMPL family transporter [Nocardia pulmonis]MCM6791329.1 MMPL family transporter [Nocardia sp. CDC159]